MTVTELSALAGALTAILGLLGYILRLVFAGLKAIEGHLGAMRENTLVTKSLSERMDRVEKLVSGGSWPSGVKQ